MLTRVESRRADENAIKKFHIPSLVLMENAGRSCAESLLSHLLQRRETERAVLVLCGPGNNGGDGFVIARHLYIAGVPVKVVLYQAPEKYSGDARLNLDALSRLRMPIIEFDSSWTETKVRQVFAKVGRAETAWVVDALLGTGASGQPRKPMALSIEIANEMSVQRFSVDIPTGLDCDTGEAAPTTFRADVTCTMVGRKAGFENSAAAEYIGEIVVVGIGAPHEIMGWPQS